MQLLSWCESHENPTGTHVEAIITPTQRWQKNNLILNEINQTHRYIYIYICEGGYFMFMIWALHITVITSHVPFTDQTEKKTQQLKIEKKKPTINHNPSLLCLAPHLDFHLFRRQLLSSTMDTTCPSLKMCTPPRRELRNRFLPSYCTRSSDY